MKEQTIAQKALNKLKSISKDRFIINEFTDEINKCCVLGHIVRLTSKNSKDYSYNNCYDNSTNFGGKLRQRSREYLNSIGSYGDISSINNSKYGIYQQETPKERSMALLKDMIAAGY